MHDTSRAAYTAWNQAYRAWLRAERTDPVLALDMALAEAAAFVRLSSAVGEPAAERAARAMFA